MPTTDEDRAEELLGDDECLRLLATASIGRLAYTESALPAVSPVSFALHGLEIVIPAPCGSSLTAAVRGAVVAFEADCYDAAERTGWYVTVVGHSRVISDVASVTALDALGPASWADQPHGCYIGVQVRLVRGARTTARHARYARQAGREETTATA